MRCIIHVDMDAFFAAVEFRDDPSLRGKPLIIGALPHERGVVSTCSYEARKFGVRSAMSIKEAYRLCPHGIYMHPNLKKYSETSKEIRKIWDTYTDLVEYISLDEGYLDVTFSEHLFGGAAKIGRDIKQRTLLQTGLTCSVGIGYSMMSAKIASEEKKPDGYFEIPNSLALKELIMERGVRVIYGVGAQTASVLEKNGIKTVRDVLINSDRIIKLLGSQGISIVRMANGEDARRVLTPPKSKSIGKEHTFQEDITDFEFLRNALRLTAKALSFKIRSKHLFCRTVTLKVTFANMTQITRSKSGGHINSTRDIFAVASNLLNKIDKKPVRLIGISLSGFSPQSAEQLSLFEFDKDDRPERLDDLMYKLQYKYGLEKIATAKEILAREILRGKN